MISENNLKLKVISHFKEESLPSHLQDIIMKGGEVYEVGGPIRDRLLGRPTKDNDILVRHLSIKQLSTILKKHGEVILVGKSFGILKFRSKEAPHIEYDIALPRKERSTGVGHRDFEISFDPELPVEEDLKRRDFTINAMAFEYTSDSLIDPFGGCADLRKRLLRQVQANSFVEDPLRLLRAVQFAARMNLTIEEKTWQSMKQHASLIESVSPERITLEIAKLLLAPKPSIGFCIMRDTGLLRYVFPELHETVGVEQGRKLKNDDVFLHTMRVLDATRDDEAISNSCDMELMLAALFHDIGKPQTKRFNKKKEHVTFFGHNTVSRRLAEKRMRQLKMTTLGIKLKNVGDLIEHHMFQAKSFFTEKAIRRFIRSIGEDLVLKLIDLRIADNRGGKYPEGIRGVQRLRKRVAEELESKPAIAVSDLAISGHDLMELGISEGPEMGHILRNLLEVVIDNPEKNQKDTLLLIVGDTLGYGTRKKEHEPKGSRKNSPKARK
jgi:tRNA nucleotidyltransferase (CCA-adding enzyme)